MRIFMNQTNLIQTTPLVDNEGVPVTTAVITVRVLDSDSAEVDSSEIILDHVAGGIYKKAMPILDDLSAIANFYLEVSVAVESIVVWYLKEPIKALVRNTQPRNV